MTMLSAMRSPVFDRALDLARDWYVGTDVDGVPPLRHVGEVAALLRRHVADAPPELLAAAVLAYAPAGTNEDRELMAQVGEAVTRLVRCAQRERLALFQPPSPAADLEDPQADFYEPQAVWVAAADLIVRVTSRVRRSMFASDHVAYWRDHREFVDRVPAWRAFHTTAGPNMPPSLARELGRTVTEAENSIRRAAQ